jgi:hypothetical protein
MSHGNQAPDILSNLSVPCENILQQWALKDLSNTHLWPGDTPTLRENSESFSLDPVAFPCMDNIPTCLPQSMELSPSSSPSTSENKTSKRDTQLSFEEEILLTLRDERSKTWREISATFENVFGRRYRAPALHMRYLRLQKRLRLSIDDDVSALLQSFMFRGLLYILEQSSPFSFENDAE